MGLFTKSMAYEDVVHYIKKLSEPEYKKIMRVVNTYRNADKSVKNVLGCTLAEYQLEYETVGEPPKMPSKKAKAKK